jgi:hypothetical protein
MLVWLAGKLPRCQFRLRVAGLSIIVRFRDGVWRVSPRCDEVDCYANVCRLAETVVDAEYDLQFWRPRHCKAVERIIGAM